MEDFNVRLLANTVYGRIFRDITRAGKFMLSDRFQCVMFAGEPVLTSSVRRDLSWDLYYSLYVHLWFADVLDHIFAYYIISRSRCLDDLNRDLPATCTWSERSSCIADKTQAFQWMFLLRFLCWFDCSFCEWRWHLEFGFWNKVWVWVLISIR